MTLLFAFILSVSVLLTGCEHDADDGNAKEENIFPGVWAATYDLRELLFVMDDSLAENKDCFPKEMNIIYILEFDETEVKMYLDEGCMDQFVETYKESLSLIADKALESIASEEGVTVDTLLNNLEYTHEQYIDAFLSELDFDSLINSISESLEIDLAGKYEYDDDTITFIYDNGDEETLTYSKTDKVIIMPLLETEELEFKKE